jgi:hypothetical protein
MMRRLLLVVALVFAIVGGFSGAHAERKSCDVFEIGIGKIVISTKPICILPCIYGQPLCAQPSTQKSAGAATVAVPGAGR